MVECPNCGGKGTWRREWNESYRVPPGEGRATVTRFADEWCKRCEGKGVVESVEAA